MECTRPAGLPDNAGVCPHGRGSFRNGEGGAHGARPFGPFRPPALPRYGFAAAPDLPDLLFLPGYSHSMSAFLEERVLTVHHWTDRLFSFTTTRDPALRFSNGHFTMIGLKVDGNPCCAPIPSPAPTTRNTSSFLSIKVPEGPLTSRLQNIQVGDTIIVGKKPTGTLLIDYLLPARTCISSAPARAWPPGWPWPATPRPTSASTRSWWCTACTGRRAGLPAAVREGPRRA